VLTVQLISKPIAPPWQDATNVLVRGILLHRNRCRYRFFGTPDSAELEGPFVRCDLASRVSRFQPSTGDHVRTLLGVFRARPRVDIYHCLFTPNPRTSLTLKLALKPMRLPIVHTICSSPDDWAATSPLLFADVIVTVSEWARRQLERAYGTNVHHIPPGVSTPVPSERAIEQLRQEHQLTEDRPYLVFSGDYEYSAAHPVLVAALPEIVRSHPDVVVIFACRTKTPQALDIEAGLKQQVAAIGLGAHVRFLRHVAHFPSLLSLATLVLFPVESLHKKMDIPLTLLEALALGKPIVSTTFGPLEELMQAPVGLGIPRRNPEALASAVSRLLANPAEAAAMGAAGQVLVRERYAADRMAHAYEDLYLSLLDTRPS
jgi:glycosyltransferase involved in cell wall biosynthesis